MQKNIKAYINKLKTNLFFQNVAVIISGAVIARIIGLFTAPIITRLYLPEHYGALSVFTAFVGISGALASLRYNVTIPLPKNEGVADNLLKLSILITLTLTTFFCLIVFQFGDFLSVKLSIEHNRQYLWVVPTAFFGAGLYQSLSFWATRHKYFKLITKTNITQSVSSRAFTIGFGFLGFKPLGLLIGLIATQATGCGSLLRKLYKERPKFFKELDVEGIKQAAFRYKRFPIYQTWSQLLLSLGTHLPVLMISSIYGAKVVGLYGLAFGMVSMPMEVIGQAVSQVYYAEIAKYGKDDPAKIYKLSLSIIKKLFFIGLTPALVLLFFGPQLFSFTFGENWYEAGEYAKILSFIILFRFLSSPIMRILDVLEKQKHQLIINITRLVIVFTVLLFSERLGFDPLSAILFYSISLTFFYIIVAVYIFNLSMKS